MIKTTVNITLDRIKYSMAYAIIDVTVQTWSGHDEGKLNIKEPLVVLREDLDKHITSDGDIESMFLFIVGEIFKRSMFRIGYGAEVVEIRDMIQNSKKYLLYYEPGSQPVMDVKVMKLPDKWYEQQAILLKGMVLATKAEGLSLFPNKKEDKCAPEAIARTPISQEEWDAKLHLGWPEYELENMYSVFVSDEQYEKQKNEED